MSYLLKDQKRTNAIDVRKFSLSILLMVSSSLLFVSCSGNCESYDEFGGCETYAANSQTKFDFTIIGQLLLVILVILIVAALIRNFTQRNQNASFIEKHKLQALLDELKLQGWLITISANSFWQPTTLYVHASCTKHPMIENQTMLWHWNHQIVGYGDSTNWKKGKTSVVPLAPKVFPPLQLKKLLVRNP